MVIALSKSRQKSENRLLAALPQDEYERLVVNMESVFLNFKQSVYEPNEPIEYVYFIQNGVISLLNVMEDGREVEVATVGNEGMVGLPVFLGADKIPGRAFSQIPGDALRMKANVFKDIVTLGTQLHDLLQRYTQALFNQIAQGAACNSVHSVEERMCRWLLMTQDRVGEDEFPLTQEFLSQMLGVRRPTVSIAASILQKAGLIRYSRGGITILDREGLEASSCECYRIINADFERLFNGD